MIGRGQPVGSFVGVEHICFDSQVVCRFVMIDSYQTLVISRIEV